MTADTYLILAAAFCVSCLIVCLYVASRPFDPRPGNRRGSLNARCPACKRPTHWRPFERGVKAALCDRCGGLP